MIVEQTGGEELTMRLTPQDGRLLANALAIAASVLGMNKTGVIACVKDVQEIAGDLNNAYTYYRELGIVVAEAGIAAGWDGE
jgi:hypothetical protein